MTVFEWIEKSLDAMSNAAFEAAMKEITADYRDALIAAGVSTLIAIPWQELQQAFMEAELVLDEDGHLYPVVRPDDPIIVKYGRRLSNEKQR